MTTQSEKNILDKAKEVMAHESKAILESSAKLDGSFANAVEVLASLSGKVVVTGLGKSGHVGRKIAATLASTGTPSFFVHPTEALHGDFGMIQKSDAVVAIANSGENLEVNEFARYARSEGLPVVGIVGNTTSTLAKICSHVVNSYVEAEADDLNLAPTSSSTTALALGDAIAVCLMQTKDFSSSDFKKLHPGGSLARRIMDISKFVRTLEEVGQVRMDTPFGDCVSAVTKNNFGIAAVIDEGKVVGAISDGDIRRAVTEKAKGSFDLIAQDMMTENPKTISINSNLVDALKTMQSITQLFVKDKSSIVGIVRLHDLLLSKLV